MAIVHGAGFRISGQVARRFVAPSGKIAFLTLEVRGERRDGTPAAKKIEMKTFDCIVEVGSLKEGQDVEVTGSVDMEQPKNKDKSAVQKDGRDLWCASLTIRAVKGAKPPEPSPADDDKLGF